jgi:hypothetical protein
MRVRLVISALAVLAACPALAVAARLPNLRVTRLSGVPATARPGQRLMLSVSVAVTGPATTRPSIVRVYLSPDAARAGAHRLPGRIVVKAGVRRAKGRLKISLPATGGVQFVLACADDAGAIRETRENDNCLAAPVRLPERPGKPAPVAAPRLDVGHTASAVIGSAGGALTTTDTRGTVYTLTVPANSLPADTAITMTPLGGLGGGTIGAKLVGGVDLEPSGTTFLRGASLSIKPKAGTAAPSAFTYDAAGAPLHFSVGTWKGGVLTIPVAHFTGYGATSAAPDAGQTGDPRVDLPNAIVGVLHGLRDGKIDADDAAKWIADIMKAYYDEVIAPEAPGAMNDDDAARQYIQDLLGFEREALLLGVADRVPPYSEGEALKMVTRVVQAAYNRHQGLCKNQHQISEGIQLLRDARELGLLGVDVGGIQDILEPCFSFRLDFDSDISVTDNTSGASGHYELELVASVPLSLTQVGANLLLTGSAQESYRQSIYYYDDTHNGCYEHQTLSNPTGSLMQATVNTPIDGGPVTVHLDLGSPHETITDDDSCAGTQVSTENVWLNDFAGFHQTEGNRNTGFDITGFTQQNAQVYATKTYSVGLGESGETTTIKLVHTPH